MRPMVQPDLTGFRDAVRSARKILVVDLAFLGDTVHLVPALWELKRNHPGAELHAVSAPVGAAVLSMAPCVDRPWGVDLDPARRSAGGQWRLIRALRRERFDAAFNFMGADRAAILTALSGARIRVAHAAGRRHFWNRWLIPNWVSRRQRDLPAFEQRRQVLAACGYVLEPPRFDLRVEDSAARWAEGVVSRGFIHVSVNASKPVNEWPLEHYVASLKSALAAAPNAHFVVTGATGPRESERLRQLQSAVADSRLQFLSESMTISQLAAVLQRSRLHVGPDSGVIHLAMALGVPTLALTREQPEYRTWRLRGPTHRALTVPCPCADTCTQPGGGGGRAACLAGIQPDQVAGIMTRFWRTGALWDT
jgi:ADP-heptose:LPS heptosyltransferase